MRIFGKKDSSKPAKPFPWFVQLGIVTFILYIAVANFTLRRDELESNKQPQNKTQGVVAAPTVPLYALQPNQQTVQLTLESQVVLDVWVQDASDAKSTVVTRFEGRLGDLKEMPQGLKAVLLRYAVPVAPSNFVVLVPSEWQKSHDEAEEKMTENSLLTIFVTLISHNL